MHKITCVPNVAIRRKTSSGSRRSSKEAASFGTIYFLICVIFIPNSSAFQNQLSTTLETGERSVTDTLEDRDLSGNLDFYRYRLRFDRFGTGSRELNGNLSQQTKYNLWYERYYKNYETLDNLDSISDEWHFGLGRALSDTVKFSLDAGFREKDYKNAPSSGYERSNAAIGLEYKHEDLWALNWDGGFINYDYTKSGNDQLKLFTKIGGWMKFFEERLKINPSYKFQKIDDDNILKDRIEHVFTVMPSYKLEMPYFDKISGYYSFGRNDTKDYEDDDRDDDLRFKYAKWHLGTGHPLTENLDASFKYGQIRRDYQNSDNDYRNWFIENKAAFKIYEDKFKKINFSTSAEHKEADYRLVDSLDYIKNVIGGNFLYRIKNNWELSPGFAFKKYDYSSSPAKNEKQYEARLEFIKELLNEALELKLAYKYVWKDYRYKSDIALWSVKAGVEWKF